MAHDTAQALIQRVFPPGLPVIALPSWSRPRLFIAARSPAARQRAAALYPAYRLRARVLRAGLRLRAICPLASRRTHADRPADVAQFAAGLFPGAVPAALLIGTPSPVQKFTLQVQSPDGRNVGYIKLACQPAAKQRLQHEQHILENLPTGLGPKALGHHALGDLHALALSPVPGNPPSPNRTPDGPLRQLLDALHTGEQQPPQRHPWLSQLKHCARIDIDPWINDLGDQPWPIVIQHGDLAPWNLLRQKKGRLAAIDWEEASLQGMAQIDLAHMLLQVDMLIGRRTPRRALEHAAGQLQRQPWPGLTHQQAHAVVHLAAYEKFLTHQRDGIDDHFPPQQWRKQLWETHT